MSRCFSIPVRLVPPCPPQDCSASNDVTMESINLTGVAVLDNYTAGNAQFRGIAGDGTYTTVTLNNSDKVLTISVNAEAINLALTSATTLVAGKVELSTDAEALAKASTTHVLTPSNLAALGASTTFAGLVELATNLEAAQGILSNVAVTPSGLANAAESYVQVGQSNTLNSNTTLVADSADLVISSATNRGIKFNSGAVLAFSAGGVMNLDNTSVLKIEGVTVPANSVLITGVTAGGPSSMLLSNFLSSNSTTNDWTVEVTESRQVTSASTLAEVADALGTLINDLSELRLPAT